MGFVVCFFNDFMVLVITGGRGEENEEEGAGEVTARLMRCVCMRG